MAEGQPRMSSEAKHGLVLFDLDGTLTDPIVGIGRSLNDALEGHGYRTLTDVEVAEFIGPPLDENFRRITGSADAPEIASLVARYRERYSDRGVTESVAYPGVREALANLAGRGLRMGVCTSKRTDFACRILERLELREFFEFVDGADVGIQKWQQIEALRTRGMLTPASILVGDRGVDIDAAHRNGLAAAGVLWGYGSLAELLAEAPEHLFESPADLVLLGATARRVPR
jgi:phosphoglycolate phosphatase